MTCSIPWWNRHRAAPRLFCYQNRRGAARWRFHQGIEQVIEVFHDDFLSADNSAARWMARRMREYVPQRQIFPDIASSISLSVGLAFSFRRIAALMIWPDWQ